jgi:hypothetical protein
MVNISILLQRILHVPRASFYRPNHPDQEKSLKIYVYIYIQRPTHLYQSYMYKEFLMMENNMSILMTQARKHILQCSYSTHIFKIHLSYL